jgi:ADP-heptose:LPS heptosyltransferase
MMPPMTSPAPIAPAPSARRAPRREAQRPRILVSRLHYTGDVLLSLPLTVALRAGGWDIHYLTDAAAQSVLEAQPEIDVRWTARPGAWQTLRLAAALHAQRYDAVIDLYCNPRSAWLTRATAAPVRVGEDRRLRRHAYTLARHLVPGRSALAQHLDAVRGLGMTPPPATRPVLHLRAAERDAGRARWRALGAGPGIVLHLGATAPAKEWPLETAIDFAQRAQQAGVRVIATTAPARPEPSVALGAACPHVTVVPAMPLRELFGLLDAAPAIVSVDGAVAHAAVALGRPTLALFGPTDPGVWFPYADFGPFRVLHAGHDCSACDRHLCPTRACMAALTAADAWTALTALLETSPTAEPS